MKTLNNILKSLAIIAIITTFTSCDKWDLKGIRGEGEVVTNTVEIEDVKGIKLEIPATVYIEQGDIQSISIEAQQNIFNNMQKSTHSNRFNLSFDKNVAQSEPIVVTMTINDLSHLEIAGAGEIIVDSKFTTNNSVDVKVSGSGEITAEFDALEANVEMAGSGNINLTGSYQRIDAEIIGSGDINLKTGFASRSTYKIAGSGNISAFDLITEECDIEIIGSGDVKVNVTDRLDVEIMGSGDVYYKGNPIIDSDVMGSGEVKRVN